VLDGAGCVDNTGVDEAKVLADVAGGADDGTERLEVGLTPDDVHAASASAAAAAAATAKRGRPTLGS
jgi:hypothetical protein